MEYDDDTGVKVVFIVMISLSEASDEEVKITNTSKYEQLSNKYTLSCSYLTTKTS